MAITDHVVRRGADGGGRVMAQAGMNYKPQTQGHFIDGNLNVQRYYYI